MEQEKQDGSEISHATLSSGMFYASRIKMLDVYILVKIVDRYGMERAIKGCELESKERCMQRKRCMISVSRAKLQHRGYL